MLWTCSSTGNKQGRRGGQLICPCVRSCVRLSCCRKRIPSTSHVIIFRYRHSVCLDLKKGCSVMKGLYCRAVSDADPKFIIQEAVSLRFLLNDWGTSVLKTLIRKANEMCTFRVHYFTRCCCPVSVWMIPASLDVCVLGNSPWGGFQTSGVHT